MYERLLDASIRPSADDLARYCGENQARFAALNDLLSARYQTTQEIRFPYGKRYGWCVTHRHSKKLVCDVFAEAGAFCVMLRLTNAQFALAYPSLSANMQICIDNRYPCGDGGWIHARVKNDDDLRDVSILLDFKCAFRTPKCKDSEDENQ